MPSRVTSWGSLRRLRQWGEGRGGSALRSLLHLALLRLHGRPASRARTHHELPICLELLGDTRAAAKPPVGVLAEHLLLLRLRPAEQLLARHDLHGARAAAALAAAVARAARVEAERQRLVELEASRYTAADIRITRLTGACTCSAPGDNLRRGRSRTVAP